MESPQKLISVVLVVLLLLGACGERSLHHKARYECAPNDAGTVDFDLYADGTFSIASSFFEEDGVPSASKSYRGHFSEGPHTFDLKFENVSHAEIEGLFAHTTEGGFVAGTDIYRINKEPGALFINGCRIIRRSEN